MQESARIAEIYQQKSQEMGYVFMFTVYGASELESHATDSSWLATWPLVRACHDLPSVTSTAAARYARSLDLNVAL